MVEQIELDRERVRNGDAERETEQFSYLPYLIPSKKKQKYKMIKMSNLTTLNILYYVEESFKVSNKHILTHLSLIKEELLNRSDLFDAAVKFLGSSVVKGILYYWNPGVYPDNVFGFISLLLPNFVRRYKEYYIKALVTKTPCVDCLQFIKERYRSEFQQFEIMKADTQLFQDAVSGMYWSDEVVEYAGVFPGIERRINLTEDLEGQIVPEISYVECEIRNRMYLVPLSRLEGLALKRDGDKEFWVRMGAVDSNWEYL